MKSVPVHDREVVQLRHLQLPSGSHFPHELLDRQDISSRAKREILAAWASDACAVESFPTLRHLPGTPFPVLYSSVVDARNQLDGREFETDPRWHTIRGDQDASAI